MKVILLEYVKNLGEKDDVVEVKPGYANNFLVPQRLAVPASSSALKVLAENQKQASHRRSQQVAAARLLLEKIESLNLRIEALVGIEDKIFGSITPLQLSNALKDNGIEIDRRKIQLDDDIKTLGQYSAIVALDREVKANLKFDVVAKSA
jgi:large subunit ribosomal protein L9